MRWGIGATVVGLCLTVAALASGCSALVDDGVRPELGVDARGEARQAAHRMIDWEGTGRVHRVDATWIDSCGHATGAGFFQRARGTTCSLEAAAVWTIEGAATPVDAVRVVGPALRESGLTSEDLVARTIQPDGSVPSLVETGTQQSVALGDGLEGDRFTVVRVTGWDSSLGLWSADESSVVDAARGLGADRRDRAVRAEGAAYVLVATIHEQYFTSYDNEPPAPPAPRPSVPPCFSGSNDCVGG